MEGGRSGDASSEGNRRADKWRLLFTPRVEAERLAGGKVSRGIFPVSARIKTGRAREEPISLVGAKAAQRKLSLVAGDVTGGGGKATTPKTKRHRVN